MPALPVPAEASAQTQLWLGSDASPSIFTAFTARLGDISIDSSVSLVKVTAQTDVAVRKLATLLDSGKLTAKLFWIPSSAQDQALFAIYQTAPPVLRSWKIVWPDGMIWLFAAWLTKFSATSKVWDALESSLELDIDGQITQQL